MNLRPATQSDIPLLQEWNEKAHVKDASGSDEMYDWEFELSRDVDREEILIAEAEDRPIGVIVLDDPAQEPQYWGDVEPNLRAIDIWIGEESDLGRGYGTQMKQLTLERCFRPPDVQAVILDTLVSNTRSHRFYERLGFKQIERRIFESEECFVYRLDRGDWPVNS